MTTAKNQTMFEYDKYGIGRLQVSTQGMIWPVRCLHCDTVYDGADVEVLARYADCSVWKSPCCNRRVDDRQWKSLPDIEPLHRSQR